MKQIIKNYAREILSIIAIVTSIIAVYEFAAHGDAILSAVFSQTGCIYMCFLALGIVLCLVIKIHFRMIVIKYYEKDTRIRLFEE